MPEPANSANAANAATPVRIAVLGVGRIGAMHAELLASRKRLGQRITSAEEERKQLKIDADPMDGFHRDSCRLPSAAELLCQEALQEEQADDRANE